MCNLLIVLVGRVGVEPKAAD